MEDSATSQLNAAQQLASSANQGSRGGADADDDELPPLEEPEEEAGEVDETGVDPKDIELVMSQVTTTHDTFTRTRALTCAF